jgi:RNA polymerase sigma factor (TIGR02999 family)
MNASPPAPVRDFPTLVQAANAGDGGARDRLFAIIYDELRRRARQQLGDLPRSTLCTTQLVHEAYLKLVDKPLALNDRAHFFRLVAQVMRQVLIDHLRERGARRRGGDGQRVTLTDQGSSEGLSLDLLALDAALRALADSDAGLADLVELRLLAGLEFDAIAQLRGQSERTVYRDWRAARAFLKLQLDHVGGAGAGA